VTNSFVLILNDKSVSRSSDFFNNVRSGIVGMSSGMTNTLVRHFFVTWNLNGTDGKSQEDTDSISQNPSFRT
jgi:hypothetical protein